MFLEMHNPNLFHGQLPWNKFEGWYFKICDKSGLSFAIIPGISMDKGDPHAFVQFLWGKENKFSYFRLPFESFKASKNPFTLSIGESIFSFESVTLKLRSETMKVDAELSFSDGVGWNPRATTHRSMGYYNFLPFMECYSQVCFIDMKVSGHITLDGATYFVENGKGYIEKNWGNAFPYSWIWVQSNCFKKSNISLTASIAHIPFPLGSFRGFLIGLLHDGDFYSFTTMNGAKISIKKGGQDVFIGAENKKYFLTLETSSIKENFILCKAPKGGRMIDLVQETLTANVKIRLIEKATKRIIVEDTGYNSGIEYGGEQMKILDQATK